MVKCLYCDYTCIRPYYLMRHIENQHPRLLMICPICLEGKREYTHNTYRLVAYGGRWGLYRHCLKTKRNKEWHRALSVLLRQGYDSQVRPRESIIAYEKYIDKIREHTIKHLPEIEEQVELLSRRYLDEKCHVSVL